MTGPSKSSRSTPGVYLSLLGLALLTLRPALQHRWMVLLLPCAIGFAYLGERRLRERARRSAAGADGRPPTWQGVLHPASLWVWPTLSKPRLYGVTGGVPADISVGADGVSVALRSRALRRRNPGHPVTIPWSTLAGARAEDIGHRRVTTFSAVRQTEVTIDVVGRPAPLILITPAADGLVAAVRNHARRVSAGPPVA